MADLSAKAGRGERAGVRVAQFVLRPAAVLPAQFCIGSVKRILPYCVLPYAVLRFVWVGLSLKGGRPRCAGGCLAAAFYGCFIYRLYSP